MEGVSGARGNLTAAACALRGLARSEASLLLSFSSSRKERQGLLREEVFLTFLYIKMDYKCLIELNPESSRTVL